MPTTEHTINDALAELLRKTRHLWKRSFIVRSENTGMLKDSTEQPDILILEPHVSPVIIETEILPAITVEIEARSRLGKQIRVTGKQVLSSIAVRLPINFRNMQSEELSNALLISDEIEMVFYSGKSPEEFERYPKKGWIKGDLFVLSTLVQLASVPPQIVEIAVNQLVSGVSEIAGLLDEMSVSNPAAIHKISQELCQEDGEQTRRMAGTILVNAFIFHEVIAGGADELSKILPLSLLRKSTGRIIKSSILAEWRKILKINYWPIFDIARRILEVIPTDGSQELIEHLGKTAEELLQNQLMRSHDLTGAVFQKLIADRKFLAAFYTTPASAALLVGLTINSSLLENAKKWENPDDVVSLRIGDFACGTGTLISTAYQRVSQLHEFAGGDAEKIHVQMMANVLVGCDVLPAAAHLTASMLAGAHPSVKYNRSSIFTMAYGRQPDGGIALGSLDLLENQRRFEILSITAKALDSEMETHHQTGNVIPHGTFDVVLMNPPFTRATGQEGNKIGVPNPMFAAFSSSSEEQKLMGKATEKLLKDSSANGNAGEASFFLILAHRKLRKGGKLGLVMPLSLLSGESWENSRKLLSNNYKNLILISICGEKNKEISFSADTGMGECLVVGEKSDQSSKRAIFVNLRNKPEYPLMGALTAEQISKNISKGNLISIEDGPIGGNPLFFGDDVIGQIIDAPLPNSGGWNLSRIADLSIAQSAYQLAVEKKIWLPTMDKTNALDIPITTIESIGSIGPYHADINSNSADGGIRGPFDIRPIESGQIPTYPILWAHDATKERMMQFEADSEGFPKKKQHLKEKAVIDRKIIDLWNTASHAHFNRDFRFNSQSTCMQFTERKCIGGRAWLSIQMNSDEFEKILTLWANSTFGLLLYWWHSNKQQMGRGSIGKIALQSLPVLDITRLSQDQISSGVEIFSKLANQPLRPFNEIDRDTVRIELDTLFSKQILGLSDSLLENNGPLDVLRKKLSREPSIFGHKSS